MLWNSISHSQKRFFVDDPNDMIKTIHEINNKCLLSIDYIPTTYFEPLKNLPCKPNKSTYFFLITFGIKRGLSLVDKAETLVSKACLLPK